MRVSVVIPTYNSGPLVVEAVESVLAQTHAAYEVIVVDDGSVDDTAERLSVFGSLVRYIRKENGGVSTARNRGVEEAGGDWIAFLDADDVWHPRKLEIQCAAIAQCGDLGLLATEVYHLPSSAPSVEANLLAIERVSLDSLILRNNIATSTVVVRASALRSAGPFDVELCGPEDHDLWIRVARVCQVGKLPLRLAGYRLAAPSSLSKNAPRMEAGMRAILAKLEHEGVFRGRPRFRRQAWAQCHFASGLMYRQAGQLVPAVNRFTRSLIIWPFWVHSSSGGSVRDRFLAIGQTIRLMLGRGVRLGARGDG